MSIVRTLFCAALCSALPVLAQAPRPAGAPPTPPVPQPDIQAAAGPEIPELGRLFFSPAERARLDELRRRPSAPQSPVAAAKSEPAPLPPPPQYVTLNGVVRRSDGSTTVWLNNKPVRGGKTDEGVMVVPSGRGTPGNVTVRVPQTGRSVDLKVGQQLEVQSGQVQETYRAQRAAVAAATTAAAPANTAAEEPPAPASAPRRSSRERDLMRDLLREIDGPDASAKPSPSGPSK